MPIKRRKVAIVGAGAVGSTVALNLVIQDICEDVTIIDINKDKAWSEAMDLNHSIAYLNRNIKIISGEYEDCKDADIVVITAAPPYIIGQKRTDMLEKASSIVKSIVNPIMKSGFNGIFIIVTNPVDVISYYVYKLSGLPANQVIGTGTSLDSARLQNAIADVMNVDPQSVLAYCLGEHGDSQMVPWSMVTVGAKKFQEILKDNKERLNHIILDKIEKNTSEVAYKIMQGKGATNYAIAATTAEIIRCIFKDLNKVIPVSAMLNGEYGVNNVYAGVPAVINGNGIKELVELKLTDEENKKFQESVEIIKKYNEMLPL